MESLREESSSKPDLAGDAFSPLPLWARAVMTLSPLILYGLFVVETEISHGNRTTVFLLSMTVGSFIGGGKFIIFAGAVENAPLGILALSGLVVYCDLATALILMANMSALYRIPVIGPRLAKAREAGYRVLKAHKWMRHATWLGLAVFIAVPFQGTGAVTGVLLGRLLGLSRWAILSSILVGSSAGSAGDLGTCTESSCQRDDGGGLPGHNVFALETVPRAKMKRFSEGSRS